MLNGVRVRVSRKVQNKKKYDMKINIIIDFEDADELIIDEEFHQDLIALIRKSKLEDVSIITIKFSKMEDIHMQVPKRH